MQSVVYYAALRLDYLCDVLRQDPNTYLASSQGAIDGCQIGGRSSIETPVPHQLRHGSLPGEFLCRVHINVVSRHKTCSIEGDLGTDAAVVRLG